MAQKILWIFVIVSIINHLLAHLAGTSLTEKEYTQMYIVVIVLALCEAIGKRDKSAKE